MRQLEPGARKRFGKGLRVVEEALRDLAELGVEAQRQVGGQHPGPVELALDVRVGNDVVGALGDPLLGAGRALLEFPFVLEEVLEEVVAPQRRRLGPGHLEAAGDGVLAVPLAVVADPAQALGLERRGLGLGALVRLGRRAVGLAEGVAAGDQRDDLLVVHRHAVEGGADVLGRQQVVAAGVRAFRVHIDQAHVGGAERAAEFAPVADALLGVHAQPLHLRAPVHVEVRLPDVFAAGREAEGAKAHRLERHVAGQDQQVGPGDLLAVLLLDRPEQAARLVDVDVVRPAVQRREALLAASAAAAAVGGAVGAGRVPGHADELRAVVAEVGGPPVLRICHQLHKVGLERLVVELLELGGVVEFLAQRMGALAVLVQQVDAQCVRPPVAVAGAAAGGVVERTLACARRGRHGVLLGGLRRVRKSLGARSGANKPIDAMSAIVNGCV